MSTIVKTASVTFTPSAGCALSWNILKVGSPSAQVDDQETTTLADSVKTHEPHPVIGYDKQSLTVDGVVALDLIATAGTMEVEYSTAGTGTTIEFCGYISSIKYGDIEVDGDRKLISEIEIMPSGDVSVS
jgi:hypothetical protein